MSSSRAFICQYPGKTCVACGQEIQIGMTMRFHEKGKKDLEHETCPRGAPPAAVPPGGAAGPAPSPAPPSGSTGASGPSGGQSLLKFVHLEAEFLAASPTGNCRILLKETWEGDIPASNRTTAIQALRDRAKELAYEGVKP